MQGHAIKDIKTVHFFFFLKLLSFHFYSITSASPYVKNFTNLLTFFSILLDFQNDFFSSNNSQSNSLLIYLRISTADLPSLPNSLPSNIFVVLLVALNIFYVCTRMYVYCIYHMPLPPCQQNFVILGKLKNILALEAIYSILFLAKFIHSGLEILRKRNGLFFKNPFSSNSLTLTLFGSCF